ncbi:MAG TPA: Sapep family Mn(2+)-dependent dipeptidase [Candidatus Limiplasma sp.]|nr:Sapep family Mn(2+)-dependent dipeptidase [Candidatus Limiplasma sp.]HRX09444.1 Sapep family Mn(2+)-dependent dipeptidase [Candidatus Limiplasma sp.]
MEQISQWIDDHKDDMIQTLQKWLSHPSLKGEAQENAPFGKEVRLALDAALADGQAMGFQVRDHEGYAGDISLGPAGVDPLGILTHLDIVPVGDGWTVDPFAGVTDDEKVIGRGASDDKGPAVAALYAMKAVLESGKPLRREVRLILGCDEESGMEDMAYYQKYADMPCEGFSPDAMYPVINTEKGLLALALRAKPAQDGLKVKQIAVGERHNVIPGKASAIIEGDAALCEEINRLSKEMLMGVEARETEGGIRLSAKGIAGHASMPESAKNALGELLLMLRAIGVQGPLKTLADVIGLEYDGESLGVKCKDMTSGDLTLNLGVLRYDEQGLYAEIDIRYPLLCNGESVIKTIQATLGDAFTVDTLHFKTPHHVSPHSKLVTALLDAYYMQTGRPRECIAIGGGTYARCLQEGVAFGALFPGEPETAHQADEYIKIDTLIQNAKIFARAILLLAGREEM